MGSTGLRATEIGFGAASLGNLYRRTGEDEAANAVARAWQRGIRYFDTAPHYGLGLSELRLGRALAAYPRDEFVVSTKVGRLLEPNPRPTALDTDGFIVPGDVHRVWDFSRDGVRRSLDASLERLGLDHVDIVYAHDPDQFRESAARDALDALGELRADGVVRAIGVGTNVTHQLAGLFADGLLDVAMVAGRYTLMDQSALATALEPARRAGGSIIAVAVFNSGLLSTPRPAPEAKYDYGRASPELVARANRLADICESHGTSLPAAAIAFPLQHPAVTSVALGMRNAAQVDSNLDRFASPVPQALWTELVDAGLVSPESIT
ncbi:aldo/keto reductase [Pengzhenrongella sicca]|uniref:aldo/keto reductase n=1 Tax=Pengzhenrongella sicca TaxID=2819238 RepID=UPI0029CA2B22|nr:aldo/keto reductase [Pengzhenrongella sicca]